MVNPNKINSKARKSKVAPSLSLDINLLISRNAELQELYSQLQKTNKELRSFYEFLKSQNEKLQRELDQLAK